MGDQALDIRAVRDRITVGKPLLGRRGGAHDRIERLSADVADISGSVYRIECSLLEQGAAYESGKPMRHVAILKILDVARADPLEQAYGQNHHEIECHVKQDLGKPKIPKHKIQMGMNI